MVNSSIRVSENHKSHEILHSELEEAKKMVKIGGIYAHYKFPENKYKVIGLGIQEATDTICVIYQAEYDPILIFVRDLKSWLETPEVNQKRSSRFILLEQ